MAKILFLLKHTHSGSGESHGNCGDGAGGLLNSTRFVAEMLTKAGVETKLIVITDNNDIDREVFLFRPDIVVIEALWVVPDKFDVLKRLHPTVKWIVSIHSNLPFLSHEGVAMEWIGEYVERGIYVAFNSKQIAEDFRTLFPRETHILYLPNFYPNIFVPHVTLPGLHIGCFGAIRPMKNQLLQAVAAIEFAERKRQSMSFHVNSSRCEHSGKNVLKNLRALFTGTRHQLVEHPWMSHPDFLRLISMMDVSMAVSFSETFCITAADAVVAGTPLVCSDQIPWASDTSIVPTTDTGKIIDTLSHLTSHPWWGNMWNLRNLIKYSNQSRTIWLEQIKHLTRK